MSKKKEQSAKLDQATRLVLAMGVYQAIKDEKDLDKVAHAIGMALLVWGSKHGRSPEEMAAEWAQQGMAAAQ